MINLSLQRQSVVPWNKALSQAAEFPPLTAVLGLYRAARGSRLPSPGAWASSSSRMYS